MRKITLGALGLLAVWSCKQDIDFDKFNEISLQPELAVPLMRGTLTLSDLVANDSTFTVDPDNGVRIITVQDSLFGFSAVEFVQIPDQDPVPLPMVNGDPPLDFDIGLGTLAGAELESAVYQEGQLKYGIQIPAAAGNDVQVEFTFKNATLGGQTFSSVFTLPANLTEMNDSLDISGLNIDFSNAGQGVNFLGLRAEILDDGGLAASVPVILTIQFTGVKVSEAVGFFGQRQVSIPDGSFDLDLEALENFASGFVLTDPKITLRAESSMGVDFTIIPNFTGINTLNDIVPLNPDSAEVKGPTTPGASITSDIIIDRNNSNIVNFLASLPQEIFYSGGAALNPNKDPLTTTNFVDANSFVNMGLEIDLPLRFSADNMRLEDTIEAGIASGEIEIDTLVLYIKTINGFPFDMNVNLTFLDSLTGDSIGNINLDLLQAATVDANGRVITKNEPPTIVRSLTKSEIDALNRTDKIRIRGSLNAPGQNNPNNSPDVKMFTDYSLEILVATQARAIIPISNEED